MVAAASTKLFYSLSLFISSVFFKKLPLFPLHVGFLCVCVALSSVVPFLWFTPAPIEAILWLRPSPQIKVPKMPMGLKWLATPSLGPVHLALTSYLPQSADNRPCNPHPPLLPVIWFSAPAMIQEKANPASPHCQSITVQAGLTCLPL